MGHAHALQVVVELGLAIVGLTHLAHRIGIAAPIVVLLGGVPLAFVPPSPDAEQRLSHQASLTGRRRRRGSAA